MIHFFNEATLDIDKNMTCIDKEKEIFDSRGGKNLWNVILFVSFNMDITWYHLFRFFCKSFNGEKLNTVDTSKN